MAEGWQTRGDSDAELHHLPRTSAAEFRVAAWKLWSNDGIRRRLRRNGQLARMSREIDDLVDRGVVPHAPPGWRDRVPAPLATT